METSLEAAGKEQRGLIPFLRRHAGLLSLLLVMILFPFIVAVLDGQTPADVLNNETGTARFPPFTRM